YGELLRAGRPAELAHAVYGVHLVPERRSNTVPSHTPMRPSNDGTVAVEMFALFVRDPTRPLTTPLQLSPAPAASA
ncbi:MAG TPA: hypothetical protein VK457_05505, partial [Chloroflexota bacterium]|nr:hypothetical protein [Chloroflexota bacterium]